MKKLIIFVLFCLIFVLGSCKKIGKYPDTNGSDNYSLEPITDENIIKTTKGLAINFVTSSNYSLEGNIKVHQNALELSGVRTVTSFKKGTYDITVDFKVLSGNTKLIITDGDKIIHEFSPNESGQTYTLNAFKRCYMKIGGESLEYELEVNCLKK